MISIMIVDDHSLLRRIVREVVEKESDLEVVAEASNGQEAALQAAQIHPDVVLMDLDMPICDGFEATERVLACSPQSRVVIFTASHQESHVFQAIQRGAIGYITKDVEPEALVNAIRCAAREELCIPRPLATRVLAQLRLSTFSQQPIAVQQTAPYQTTSATATIAYKIPSRPTAQPGNTMENYLRPLTDREQEILDLMRKGRKNREIAEELHIAESTVHKHIQNIFEKLHARNRTEAIYLTNAIG